MGVGPISEHAKTDGVCSGEWAIKFRCQRYYFNTRYSVIGVALMIFL